VSRPIDERLAAAGLPALARPVWAEIDLDALAGNLAAIRSAVGPQVRVEPVVKADAYGHGAVPCARALEAAGADGFSVATLDEAYELRAAGITKPLLVLYPIAAAHVPAAATAGIATSIGPGLAGERILAAAAANAPGGGPPLDVHVEIETGLGRGGALPADAADLVERVRRTPGARLAGVWTHLAAADNATYTQAQDAQFAAVLGTLDPELGLGAHPGGTRRHLAGSGGVLGGHASTWDAVRPGIAVYGLVPDGLATAPDQAGPAAALRPVLSLLARPVRVVDLPAGHGIGYGPVFFTQRPSRIATLALGYGDGWHRVLTGAASALVRGIRVPLVGRVSMDAVMADVTDVPGDPVDEDDEFVLIGRQGAARITAYEVASAGGTISYEVVTGVSRRVARVYHAAGSVAGLRTLAG
jgi:alanine racemase